MAAAAGLQLPKGLRLDLDERTDDLTPEAKACRASGHWWDPVPSPHERRTAIARLAKEGVRELHQRCDRCEATGRWELDRAGAVLKSVINYPAGYLMPPGTGRLPRGAARNALWISA